MSDGKSNASPVVVALCVAAGVALFAGVLWEALSRGWWRGAAMLLGGGGAFPVVLYLVSQKKQWEERPFLKGFIASLSAAVSVAIVPGISAKLLGGSFDVSGASTAVCVAFVLLATVCIVLHYLMLRDQRSQSHPPVDPRQSLPPIPPPEPERVLVEAPAAPSARPVGRSIGTPFYGRKDELEEVVASILAGPPAAVVLLGPPGIGKSTVSQVAMREPEVVAKFGNRRYFVELETAHTREQVIIELAKRLGVPTSSESLVDAVCFKLGEAPTLLILDNTETPWEADQANVEALIERLLDIEQVVLAASIRGNELPGGSLKEAIALRLRKLSTEAACQAFLKYAEIDESVEWLQIKEERESLRGLVEEAAECLPLALMLLGHQAVGRTSLVSLWKERWKREGTKLLKRGNGAQTRLSNVEVSIELSITSPRMTPLAHRLLRVLAYWPAGVAGDDLKEVFPEDPETAAATLRNLGLIHTDGSRRRMLAPIREYIARTHQPETNDLYAGAEHYAGLAAAFNEQAGRDGSAEAVLRLSTEAPNVEKSLGVASNAMQTAKVARSAVGWGQFIDLSAIGDTAILESVAARCQVAHDLLGQAHCIKILGDIALRRSDFAEARRRHKRAMRLFKGEGYLLGQANCAHRLGAIALEQLDFEQARRRCMDAARLYKRIGRLGGPASGLQGLANCLRMLGCIALARSDHAKARQACEEAKWVHEKYGSLLGQANCVRSLGDIALQEGDKAAARHQFEDALAIYARIPDPYSMGSTNVRLARLANSADDRRQHVRQARDLWHAIDRPDLIEGVLREEFPGDLD